MFCLKLNLFAALSSGQSTVLAGGNDFYSSPRLDKDGTRLAWVTWNHPNMPWYVTANPDCSTQLPIEVVNPSSLMRGQYDLLYCCQSDASVTMIIDATSKRGILKDWLMRRDDTELWVADVSADGSLSGQRKVGRLLNR